MARPARKWVAGIAALTLCITGGQAAAGGADREPLKIPDTQLEPTSWAALDGWNTDDHIASFSAFMKSCAPFLATREPHSERPIQVALWHICRSAARLRAQSSPEAQAFFEENFTPVSIARLGESNGLLTGYYEPVVEGSRFPTPEFHVPLYRRPADLLVDGHPVGRGEVPNRAVINRRNDKDELVPYYDRAAIENGALDGQHLEICWLRDPFEALAIQIQGSAQVRLEDGTILRVNYDAHNGHPYAAVGRILIEQYGVSPEGMSMERIRQWMLANPDLADKVRQSNRSFVFFRITGLSDERAAVGAQGVPLSPGRSIAVDKVHVYGTPFFIAAELPIDGDRADTRFRRLMIAQDTGSAIIGPARADLFWGAGDTAGRIAGRIRQRGQFVMLLPRELDLLEAGEHTPLPPPRPPVASAKAETGKMAGKADHAEDIDKPAAKEPKAGKPAFRREPARIRSKFGT
jgi:membrane-bound lytic murein transglycosylase A